MEQRNIIEWSKHSEYTELTIPSGEIWMSESEMVDLFGVFIPKLRTLSKSSTKRDSLSPTKLREPSKRETNFISPYIIWRLFCCLPFALTPIRQGQSVRN